ncbi:MAG: hypothetical protein FWD63_08210 [Propionibacteriaceae bacterium]|nr:hypothetical protein [Propionibacteriaceae bacterium]
MPGRSVFLTRTVSRLSAAALIASLLVGLAGCAMLGKPVIEATASIAPDVLAKGKLIQVGIGGQLLEDNISIPVAGIEKDDAGQPVVMVGIDSPESTSPGRIYPLHLGETVLVDKMVNLTLVSFDRVGTRSQAVTFLFAWA